MEQIIKGRKYATRKQINEDRKIEVRKANAIRRIQKHESKGNMSESA